MLEKELGDALEYCLLACVYGQLSQFSYLEGGTRSSQ